MFPIRTILYATDFSPSADHAFHMAASLARDHGARLLVLHVVPPVLVGFEMPPPPPVPPEVYTEKIWETFRRLEAADPRVREVNLETRLAEGSPAMEILSLAREAEADLIVMGTHGRTGLRRLVMGSVAELVVRRALCPVLTVKMPAEKSAPAVAGELVGAKL